MAVYMDLSSKCLRGCDPERYRAGGGRLRFLANGRARIGRHDVYSVANEELTGVGVMVTEPVSPLGLPLSDDGSGLWDAIAPHLYLQAEPSIMAARALAAGTPDGSRILDMCAAPGGKTLAIADAVAPSVDVYALDRLSGKVARLLKDARSRGYTRVHPFVCNAAKSVLAGPRRCKGDPAPFRWDALPPVGRKIRGFPAGGFQRVLLDAPCSGTGQRPYFSLPGPAINPAANADYQRVLLRAAWALLAAGGRLVYSTCSLFAEENEDNVRWALSNLPGCYAAADGREEGWLGHPGIGGVGVRFDPDRCPTTGFFYAVLQKSENAPPAAPPLCPGARPPPDLQPCGEPAVT